MSTPLMLRGIVAFMILLVSACATPLKPALDSESETWQLQGKIGLWFNDKQESATIDWSQCNANKTRIRLSGPLGTGAIELSADQSGATLLQGGETIKADSIEALADRAAWPIPVDALRFWVRGRAQPTEKLDGRVNTNGQLEYLTQLGWQINYRYRTPFHQLPNKIMAESSSSRLTVIISDWYDQPKLCSQ
ncbi:Outer-membrane lipoprotein LolB [Zhongshania aliphaticivorans]|uniref:Outer-membrane lipoprotein LolB n=1 Tax=Zhongshania aliphaticivorans TaxID=1470434 RepID=A0A5S9N4G5_9GAMM|nr:lipoprotein insertase outer membrane protein LolB [Zhongshania aliphaticivorans]CAA0083165.1 Outer-membrane lipoprotein LolB [Zhongshania aliphaticivorans]CAA0083624.1 Outer-membrane lipoprotein LolB [Zhongshania aliphaticivorans]